MASVEQQLAEMKAMLQLQQKKLEDQAATISQMGGGASLPTDSKNVGYSGKKKD